uniref:Transmembrane protein n=1 Tax=Medicago truncatula TaxID=3880 RepID=A4PRJ0_MEDTR|nr:hypothetical protein MtrDRAFT_AC139526g30v2 [Medicago truncatula]
MRVLMSGWSVTLLVGFERMITFSGLLCLVSLLLCCGMRGIKWCLMVKGLMFQMLRVNLYNKRSN